MSRNPATGWHERATTGALFEPTKESFVFAVKHSTPVDPNGLTVAFFAPKRAVDADGRALTLEQADFDALVSGASAVAALPRTCQWRVASEVTCRPINYIKFKDEKTQQTVDVYNWNERTRALEEQTEGYTELPDPIQNLLKLAHEAAHGAIPERGSDLELVQKVKDVLQSTA